MSYRHRRGPNGSPDTNGHHQGPRILIVEDEPDVLAVLQRFFSLEGYRTTVATTGPQALEMVRAGRFDLVLTDYSLPGATGMDVARAVREAHGDTPVVITTGWDYEPDPVELERNGVEKVLTKPFDLDVVLDLVAQLVQAPSGVPVAD